MSLSVSVPVLFFFLLVGTGCTKGPQAPRFHPIWTNYQINSSVYALAVEGNFLWVGSEKGLIKYNLITDQVVEKYDPQNGLPASIVTTIKIDSNGHKWVGTHGGGLGRFDGKRWKVYNPPDIADSYVYDIVFDGEGQTWVATWKGVSLFNGESWRSYTVADGLPDKWVYAIGIERSGIKWFGTEGGVTTFDGTAWKTYTHRDGLGASPGQVGEIEKLHNPSSYHTREREKVAEGYNPNFVLSIAIGPDETKWFGTWGAGLSRFDGKEWRNYTTRDGLAGNFVSDLLIDHEGRLWITTEGGVTLFDGKEFTSFTEEQGLIQDSVFTVVKDQGGVLWFGAMGGISKLERIVSVASGQISLDKKREFSHSRGIF